MIAVDTNILVRIVTNDEPDQALRATELLQDNPVFIAKTVLLELEWVLRYCYKLDQSIIASTLEKILTTQSFTVEHHAAISQALHWYRQGMDFADALHLASSDHINKFASFDRKLINKAKTIASPVILFTP